MSTSLVRSQDFWSFEQALDRCKIIVTTALCPQNYKGKPNDALVAIISGQELGLSPMQALSSIAVINGRSCLWGDAMLGLCYASGLIEDIIETVQDGVARCRVKRKGIASYKEQVFSIDDAKQANLWGKSGPWTTYPKRMLQMRARAFCLRDAFPDVLKGIYSVEEAMDMDTSLVDTPKNGDFSSEKSASKKMDGLIFDAEITENKLDGYIELAETKHSRQELLELYGDAKKELSDSDLETFSTICKKIIQEKSLA